MIALGSHGQRDSVIPEFNLKSKAGSRLEIRFELGNT